MSLKEENKSSKSSDIKDELKEMLAEPHKDEYWSSNKSIRFIPTFKGKLGHTTKRFR